MTLTSAGLQSSKVDFQIAPFQLIVSITASTPKGFGFIYQNQTASLTFTASFEGAPLRNLNVTWGSSGGTLTPAKSNTGHFGTASTTFKPKSSGTFNITAIASAPATGTISAYYLLQVVQTPQKSQTISGVIGSYWYFIVAVAVAVVLAIYYVLRLRRKKQKTEIETGFETVS